VRDEVLPPAFFFFKLSCCFLSVGARSVRGPPGRVVACSFRVCVACVCVCVRGGWWSERAGGGSDARVTPRAARTPAVKKSETREERNQKKKEKKNGEGRRGSVCAAPVVGVQTKTTHTTGPAWPKTTHTQLRAFAAVPAVPPASLSLSLISNSVAGGCACCVFLLPTRACPSTPLHTSHLCPTPASVVPARHARTLVDWGTRGERGGGGEVLCGCLGCAWACLYY
jgi:hypothetical protein